MLCWPKVYHRVRIIYGYQLTNSLSLKLTNSLSVWQPKKHSKTRSLVLWRNVMAWGFFYTLSSCRLTQLLRMKRPRKSRNYRDSGNEENVPRMSVRGRRHEENVTEFDGTEGWRNVTFRFDMTFSELVISGGNHVHELCNSLTVVFSDTHD